MSEAKAVAPKMEETPVDDVRRVRAKLSQQAENDVNRLADCAGQVAEDLREKLGLRRVAR
ncbi:MAG: hypothetical protein U1D55_12145 [Phycisphaerae bacterium]